MTNQECCGGYQVAKVLLDEEKKKIVPIRGRSSVTETLDLGSTPWLGVHQ